MDGLSRRRFLATSAIAAPMLAGTVGSQEAGAARAAPKSGAEAGLPPGWLATGADMLAADGWKRLRGRKFGVITNPTGVLRDLTHVVDAMVAAGVGPTAAFGPEHGFRGTAQAGGSEGNATDPRTGLPVYDAYGATPEKLADTFRKIGLEAVVFDIADVGSRFYTYIWTMYTAMQAAAAAGASFIVLDRPNPVGGQAFGPQLDSAFATGVGRKPIVQQHGMTVGELARLFNAEFLPADGGALATVDVVGVRGWRRDQLFTTTGQLWVPPSPNMPFPDTALVYPGTCLFEGTVLSEGRGTTRPFETVGAPKIDWRWAEALNASRLPGVRFRETYFVPTFDKFQKVACGGVQIHLTDRSVYDPIRTAVTMITTAKRLYPDVFGWRPDNWIDKLSGSDRLRHMVDAGSGVDEIVGSWQNELSTFRALRRQYLIYQ